MAGNTYAMAGLQEALAATGGMAHPAEPPNLREAAGRDRCLTCRFWKARASGIGACRLYAGFKTYADDVCDSYEP